MKQLLLTGFETFLNFSVNPSLVIADELHGEYIGGYYITGKILPVDFHQSGKRLRELISTYEPDTVVSLGLAAGRHCITPERIAINCNDGLADNKGHQPNGEKIVAEGADAYFSTLPNQHMVTALHQTGFPAKISNSAGAYLCNHVMYQAQYFYHQRGEQRPAGFIHLPASHKLAVEKDMPSWSQADLKRAVEVAIDSLTDR